MIGFQQYRRDVPRIEKLRDPLLRVSICPPCVTIDQSNVRRCVDSQDPDGRAEPDFSSVSGCTMPLALNRSTYIAIYEAACSELALDAWVLPLASLSSSLVVPLAEPLSPLPVVSSPESLPSTPVVPFPLPLISDRSAVSAQDETELEPTPWMSSEIRPFTSVLEDGSMALISAFGMAMLAVKFAASPLAGHRSGSGKMQGSSVVLYTSSPSAVTDMLSVAFPGTVAWPVMLKITVALAGEKDMLKVVTFVWWLS